MHMVFETLCHHKLFAKRSKCSFAHSKVAFLGHILSVNCVKADPAKVDAVRHWATPTSFVEVLRFQQYIKRFSELASLLSSLTGPFVGATLSSAFLRA